VTMYMIPICFASVVRMMRPRADPLIGRRTGQGRVTIGSGTTLGATVVTGISPITSAHFAALTLGR
jgi:hypothetical protein